MQNPNPKPQLKRPPKRFKSMRPPIGSQIPSFQLPTALPLKPTKRKIKLIDPKTLRTGYTRETYMGQLNITELLKKKF